MAKALFYITKEVLMDVGVGVDNKDINMKSQKQFTRQDERSSLLDVTDV